MSITVEEVAILSERDLTELSELLIRNVEAGHSIGYLRPPSVEVATTYWQGVFAPNVRLLLARDDGRIVGTAQLELATKENGRHRAEVNRVLVHPAAQGKGVGRLLMIQIEEVARREGRSLLYLDTNSEGPARAFYRRLGWEEVGTIPQWAGSPPDNRLAGTTFYYKLLSNLDV